MGVIIPNFYLYTSELARKISSYQAKSALTVSGAPKLPIHHPTEKIGEQKFGVGFFGGIASNPVIEEMAADNGDPRSL